MTDDASEGDPSTNDPAHAAAIEVVEADITTLEVDAIVNAANEALRGGGGVDGAIHRAAGPALLAACAEIGGCPTGEARITRGFRLPAKHVIHAVGPIWRGGDAEEDALLAGCYRASFALMEAHQLESIGFPSISTGVFGFPADRAARIAVRETRAALRLYPHISRVVFCCFGPGSGDHHRAALAEQA